MTPYNGFIPPCGIYCGECPYYLDGRCQGAEIYCHERRCKSFYYCCLEKKSLRFCYECKTFPCSRFKQFTKQWEKYGQDLIDNQEKLRELDEEGWLKMWHDLTEDHDD